MTKTTTTKAYIHLAEHPSGPDVIAASDFADQVEILAGTRPHGNNGEDPSTCTVTWYKVGGRLRPRVEVFDEDWSTFSDAADVFATLSSLTDSAIGPDDFCQMLDDMGYVNITDTGT